MSLAADKANFNDQLFCYEQLDATAKLKILIAGKSSFSNDVVPGFFCPLSNGQI